MAGRFAAYLLSLSQRFAQRGQPAYELALPMSRTDIGNYLGLAKETVTRLFARFEEQGLIEVRARRLSLTDPTGLQRVAGELGDSAQLSA